MAVILMFVISIILAVTLWSGVVVGIYRLIRRLVANPPHNPGPRSQSVSWRFDGNQCKETESLEITKLMQDPNKPLTNRWERLSFVAKILLVIVGGIIIMLGVLAFVGIGLAVLVPFALRIVMMAIPFLIFLLVGYWLYGIVTK